MPFRCNSRWIASYQDSDYGIVIWVVDVVRKPLDDVEQVGYEIVFN